MGIEVKGRTFSSHTGRTSGLPVGIFTQGIPGEVDEAAATLLPEAVYPIDQISGLHARSYELGDAQRVTAVWQDRHGNRFTSLSYKGCNFKAPGIMRSLTAPSGFIPHGLQEDDALLRIVKSSRILREGGIPTEWIVAITEPSKLPYEGELVDQREYKRRFTEKILGSWAFEEAAEVATAIEPMTFYVTTRCMEINDRPFDFLEDSSPEDVQLRLHKIFTVYNLTHRKDPEFVELDAGNEAHCQYYFTTLLPILQGRNLARLHNIGLVHKFPVPGNVTALGGIIDLDSIHGEPLGIGDPAIVFQDIAQDMAMVFEKSDRSYIAILRHMHVVTGWPTEDAHETLYQMQRNFLQAYQDHSSRQFSSTEQCLMFLGMNQSEYHGNLANQALAYVCELLTEHDTLVTTVFEELAQLVIVEEQHLGLDDTIDQYATSAVYAALERDELPKSQTELEEHLDRLTAIVRKDMAMDAIHECIDIVINSGVSNAFDTLVNTLKINGRENADMRTVLARSLFASPTFLHLHYKSQL